MHTACATAAPCPLASRAASRSASYALPSTRQFGGLSDANKLLIRCAWAGTPAFASAGYGSSWGPGTCPATFTTKASLRTAVQAYDTNPTAAIEEYGPIADWCVSTITDMSWLFSQLKNFNADISNWDTSSVTTMRQMFRVRSARAKVESGPTRATATVAATQRPYASRAAPLPAWHARPSTRQEASAFNQPLSFDTSKVTNMGYMFHVRSARSCPAPSQS